MNTTSHAVLSLILSSALPILSHHCHGQAMERHIETFTMPMEDWTRIPAVVRDDHRQLYKKCLEGLASGKVERIDRIGGAVGKTPFRFNTSQLLPRASTFVLKDGKLEASEITNESVGSRFESGPIKVDGKAALGIRYDRIPPSIGAAAMLGRGSRDDINPLFPALRSGPLALSGASRRKQIPCSKGLEIVRISCRQATSIHRGGKRIFCYFVSPFKCERNVYLSVTLNVLAADF